VRKRSVSALGHPGVRKASGGAFAGITGAVVIPLLFIEGTTLNHGAFPYLIGGLVVSAGIFVASWLIARSEARPEASGPDESPVIQPVDRESIKAGARLHSRGVALRDGIRPVGPEPLGELVGGVREWERAARRWIEDANPGAVAEFDAGPPLSDPAVHLIAAQATSRQRREIVEYMDRKLRVLGGIVADLSPPAR
jgi:hypothetical protein